MKSARTSLLPINVVLGEGQPGASPCQTAPKRLSQGVEGTHLPACVGLRLQKVHPEAAFQVPCASSLPGAEASAGSGGLARATRRHRDNR